jgi:hypothetical protein
MCVDQIPSAVGIGSGAYEIPDGYVMEVVEEENGIQSADDFQRFNYYGLPRAGLIVYFDENGQVTGKELVRIRPGTWAAMVRYYFARWNRWW